MAEFRQIHTRIWKDSWFSDLDTDAKLLFVYLFSNEQAEVGGVYELPIKYMSFEVGIPQDRVRELLELFEKAGKIFYRDTWVWVVNLRKYNETKSDTVRSRITKDLENMPDGELKGMYCKHHNIPYRYPIDTLSETQTGGIDTHENIFSETERRQKGEETDTLPTSPADWMTPQMEAQRVIQEVTGFVSSPPDEIEKYTNMILALKDKHNSHTVEYLKPFYEDWCGRKTKDGKPYKKTSICWIEWANEGAAPPAPQAQPRRRKPVEE